MAASLETVREKMKVEPTRDDKGLTLTLAITAMTMTSSWLMVVQSAPLTRHIVGYRLMKSWALQCRNSIVNSTPDKNRK